MKSVIEHEGKFQDFEYVVKIFEDGHRCGYVKVSDELFSKDLESLITCHGGITFKDNNVKDYLPVGNWIGFDALHFGDSPDYESAQKYFPVESLTWKNLMGNVYKGFELRSKDYMIKECENIIKQLVNI